MIAVYLESIIHLELQLFCRETTQDLFVVMGALYAACLFLGVNNSSSVQPVVSVERTVYYRETAARMYSSFPYAAAQVSTNVWANSVNFFNYYLTISTFLSHKQGLVEIPYIVAQTLIFGTITYFMVNYERAISKSQPIFILEFYVLKIFAMLKEKAIFLNR